MLKVHAIAGPQDFQSIASNYKALFSNSKMMMKKGNVLILDEPTNHLDLESITAFNNSLNKFKGTILLSTHDHQFAQTIANRIIEITPKGVIDRYMKFDEYMNDDKIKQLRSEMYELS